MNQLTIHHLAKRLPYGVKKIQWARCYGLDSPLIKEVELSNVESLIDGSSTAKIALFPLSALTREITVNGETFVPIERMRDLYNNQSGSFISRLDYVDVCETFTLFGLEEDDSYEVSMPYLMYEFLHQHHIDYENLIPVGLAISVFDLPENPYK